MSEVNAEKRQEKIIQMKLQTAKVLWGENRKEATFLILESIDDARADGLREKMGFDDNFEVGRASSQSISLPIIGVSAIVLIVLSFLLGTFLNVDGGGTSSNQILIQEPVVPTIIVPTIQPTESLDQPIVEMTGAASQIQLTRLSLETQQSSFTDIVNASETAKYDQATATEDARATENAGK